MYLHENVSYNEPIMPLQKTLASVHAFIGFLVFILTHQCCLYVITLLVWSLDTVEVSKYYSHFYTLCPSGSLPSKWTE